MTTSPTDPASRFRVLIIDDEKNIRSTLMICLESMGLHATAAASPEEALVALETDFFDLAFLDLRLGTASGFDLLPGLLAANPHLLVIVITAFASLETAMETVRRGAFDLLPKPFTPVQVRQMIEKVRTRLALEHRLDKLESDLRESCPEASFESQAPSMRQVLALATGAAASAASLLLRGESGTGKGVLARFLHASSPRHSQPFVTVSCPTLTDELLGSELFGHARGSFTGALRDRPGKIETAENGTLFLDEISEIAPSVQARLLRFLQEKQFERLGENRVRRSDVRIIAATNRDLEAAVKAGTFREDLLFRINVVEITLPPLRERREDILPLARRFIGFFARQLGRHPPELSPRAQEALLAHSWPGNLRELRNAIERALIVWPAPLLEPEAFPERISRPSTTIPMIGSDMSLENLEKAHILRVLARHPTQEEAAKILGIDTSTLWRKRQRWEKA
ncbi:MAG TPA: sigma-54 dependent transcriptional regulator [Candidatus Ozemobacteraceae bacterium]|nr:sigma-54 dependent transcriptional regulator [Candidatus Ozemobacteraceae bacterium]